MDKETISTYGMILISIVLISLLLAMATPVGDIILNDVQTKMIKLVDNSGVMDASTNPENYGTIVVHYRYKNTMDDIKTYKATVRLNEYCLIDYPEIVGYRPENEDGSNAQAKVQVRENLKHIYIYYTPETYQINYVMNGGSWTSDATYNLEYQYGSTYTLPTDDWVVKEGYKFVGWYEDSGLGGSRTYTITDKDYGDKIYFAKYTML